MPARPPLSSTHAAVRLRPACAGLVLIATALATPGTPKRPTEPTGPLGEAWTDTAAVPAGGAVSPRQKKPPCIPVVEVEWDNLCWVPHAARPPCPPALVEGAGKCLVRVVAPPPPNTSVAP